MKEKDLIKLGFVNESYEDDGNHFTEFVLKTDDFIIEYYGVDMVEIKLPYVNWIDVPNCKHLQDMKDLIRLFSKSPD